MVRGDSYGAADAVSVERDREDGLRVTSKADFEGAAVGDGTDAKRVSWQATGQPEYCRVKTRWPDLGKPGEAQEETREEKRTFRSRSLQSRARLLQRDAEL
jgi:hypothetical protein